MNTTFRCHDAEACAMGQKKCPMPTACGIHQIQGPAVNQQLTAALVAAMTNALREAEAALEVAMARILKADPGHSISATSEAKALVAVRQALSAQAAPVAVGEREAFQKWMSEGGKWPSAIEREGNGDYKLMQAASAWNVWQARAALAATPADHIADAGKMVLPAGWVPCIVTHEGQHPEEVAYGPQVMMDRLKKWLDRNLAALAQPQEPKQ